MHGHQRHLTWHSKMKCTPGVYPFVLNCKGMELVGGGGEVINDLPVKLQQP